MVLVIARGRLDLKGGGGAKTLKGELEKQL
jgi:hypothetical protein